ncbi:MAG: exodeoxyribonuclease VII large subunit [Candidatus Neomarinimicrobiota bacterium]
MFTVSQITSQVRAILETSFPSIWVEGEISNFKHHTSGHMYFTLKDDRSELKAVMFRRDNQFLRFSVEDGMKVLAEGAVTVYEARGIYQLVVRRMEPAGLGTLYLAFEALKKKLAEEGLFADERKRPIPRYPSMVGVVTSPTGAAIQDIKNILARRAPHVRIIIRPALVQGDDAADDIVDAIRDFGEFGGIDTLILGRGGGSLEDLWPFNEEKVARAMFDCSIPIISAVGHESDFTIADMVADLRAPTPSAAAELVSPSRQEIQVFLEESERRQREALLTMLKMAWQRLDSLMGRYGFRQPQVLVDQKKQRVDDLRERMGQRMTFVVGLHLSAFEGLEKRLLGASPMGILRRGYSIAYNPHNKHIIKSVKLLEIGKRFALIMSDGETTVETKEIREE